MLIKWTAKALPIHHSTDYFGNGAIGGTGAGLVTAADNPASKPVYLFDAQNMTLLKTQRSQANGQYLFRALNADKKYLIMVRDDNHGYEPFAWDWVTPDTTLTAEQQLELAEQIFGA